MRHSVKRERAQNPKVESTHEVEGWEPLLPRKGSMERMIQMRQACGLTGETVMSVQMKKSEGGRPTAKNVHQIATRGLAGSVRTLPYLDTVQKSFGQHDITGIRAYVGGAAKEANTRLGARAYATGDAVAFKDAPDLHTAAHEAAHIVQQRAGVSLSSGVGRVGDAYEQHADKVAHAVVEGRTAEPLLNAFVGGSRGRASIQFDRGDESTPDEEARHEFESWQANNPFTLQSFMNRWYETELHGMASDSGFLDRMQAGLGAQQFAWLALGIMLKYSYAPSARPEAMRLMGMQLNDPSVARRLIANRTQVVIVPRNQRMTALSEFSSLENQQTFDGRWWAHVRGVGGLQVSGRVYVAITEENLLGGAPDASVFDAIPEAGVPQGAVQGGYQAGYSTTTHEFGHVIHDQGLEGADRQIIEQTYESKKRDTERAPALFQDRWVDGPRVSPTAPSSMAATYATPAAWQQHVAGMSGADRRAIECYASQTDHEFFAQLTNAYLNTNTGNDPRTHQARHNGRAWIAANEPANLLALLDRLYQNQAASGASGEGAGGAGVAGPIATPLAVPEGGAGGGSD